LGIVYLCCDDLDPEALASLARLRYRGRLHLIVHDDSPTPSGRAAVDAAVARLRPRGRCEVRVLRRPRREGGKAGAVNYVLEQTAHLYAFFLLCDNDSTALDPRTVERALPYFADERVAVVQCRSVAVDSPGYCPANRLLARSIDAFDVFLTTWARFGWRPFIGHNALLRTRAVREAGDFTPGYFADDLDMTVRLNLRGHAVVYAPEIAIGEKHPPSYAAFRKRSYKWAYGCVQTLRAHAWAVLTSRRFSLPEKLSFFQFAGFYVGQTLLLLYLAVSFLLAPLVLGGDAIDPPADLLAGGVIVLTVFAPVLAYFARARRLRESLGSVLLCGLVYGATDFAVARGVWDCLRNRQRQWVPTNAPTRGRDGRAALAEALFGLALLSVPLLTSPAVLYLPCAYLFAGKFLFAPAMSVLYDDRRRPPLPRPPRLAQTGAIALLLGLLLAGSGALPSRAVAAPADGPVEVRGRQLLVDGQPFLVKGVHYSPWRPGTGPGKGYPYPDRSAIEADLRLVRGLGANTILVFDAPDDVLDVAHEQGLRVLYTFYLDWWTFGSPEDAAARARVLERVRTLRGKPALLGWVLGNEVPSQVLAQRGAAPIENGLAELYRAVKAVDPQHPVTHSNWPVARELDLRFLDIVSFNVYPLWPPEVVAAGYGPYVERVLRPLAADRPLLITEFGADTVQTDEAGQARLLRQSWDGLRGAGAAGGVVFEFADEWWKNYDNPKRPGDWWDRQPAADDEVREDPDPEEHYGIVTADRRPKAAFAAVREMFADQPATGAGLAPAAAVGAVALLAAGLWAWSQWGGRPGAALSAPVTSRSPEPAEPAADGSRNARGRPADRPRGRRPIDPGTAERGGGRRYDRR
jgi:GT2 family glycosyltransferase